MIFHITTPDYWEKWAELNHFEPPTFQEEGFIHNCTESQIDGVLERYFVGINQIVLLHVDTTLLEAPLEWEVGTNEELFPHIYGSLNKTAVVGIEVLIRD
jgi:uncharacterized protein (DUF952 family)